MNLTLYTDKIEKYLSANNIIDYDNELIIQLSDSLSDKAKDDLDYIRLALTSNRYHSPSIIGALL